jgi:hypothetical protein
MQSPPLNFVPRGLYIAGRWVSPVEDRSFASINPSNLEKLADIPAAGEADVDAAVAVAKAGFKPLRSESRRPATPCSNVCLRPSEIRAFQHLIENVVILLRGRRGVEQIRELCMAVPLPN